MKRQVWKCDRNDPYYVWQEHSKGYLHHGDHGNYVSSHVNRNTALKWKRRGSNQTLCSEAVGCETFQDGSSLVVLNQTVKCHEKSECWGEKEVNIGREVTECSLLPDQTQYLHKDGWQRLLVETESFDVVTNENKTSLKWDLTKTPMSWKGLIVKVQFQCKGSGEYQYNKEVHCVLIKYKGLFTGFHKSEQSENEIDKTQTTVVIVCVLIITFVIGIVVFLAYRNKNRLAKLIRRGSEKPDETRHASPGQKSGDSNNPIYHSSHSAQNDCQLYEATEPEPVYQYANAGHEIEAQPPPKLTYDYALPEDRPRIGQRTCVGKDGDLAGENKMLQHASELNNSKNTPHMYHVLENN
ncbi:Hypothetical predicted protein [Paramuricea clavata]|uniref:Uncharacterized protein n=1 Tax=Paramuricea clavata TaxID=317549 RepID=A0A7D9EBE5_PARCT|nr:Hypothetical predicted protein [Paramuricea clavata]